MKRLLIFWEFVKIGTFSFGGGVSVLAVFNDEFVEKKKLLTYPEFMRTYALSKLVPGVNTVAMTLAFGKKFGGYGGSFAALLGFYLVPFISTLLFTLFYLSFKPFMDNVAKIVMPAVLGIILATGEKFRKTEAGSLNAFIMVFLIIISLVYFRIPTVAIILLSGLIGVIWAVRKKAIKKV